MKSKKTYSTDYHDYVIKDGRLVGQFEEMYVHSAEVPWHQDSQSDWLDVRLGCELMADAAPFDFMLDFAMGLGYYVETLASRLGSSSTIVAGLDVSETACLRGKERFPRIRCDAFDLAVEPGSREVPPAAVLPEGTARPLYALRATIWYLVPFLEKAIANMAGAIRRGDFFLLSQNFPPLDSEFVGKEEIPGPERLLEYFSPHFEVERSMWVRHHLSRGNDNWLIARLRRR